MKFCVSAQSKYIKEKDTEILVRIDGKPQEMFKLNKTLKKIDSDKSVIIRISNLDEILHTVLDAGTEQAYIDLFKQYPNVKLQVSLLEMNDENVSFLSESGIPFFFEEVVTNWADFDYFVNSYNVSDVVIGGDICFSMRKLRDFANTKEIKLRYNVNKIYSESKYCWFNDITSFFIRPEDIELYSEYIDVIMLHDNEKMIKDDSGSSVQDTLYEIYSIGQTWMGSLNILYHNLHIDIYSADLPHVFTKNRLNCEHRCKKGIPCSSCYQCGRLAMDLRKKHWKFETLEENN